MADSYLPLRWEGTGDQWWYASPIDWAAANGHYDLVRELLHIDSNLLIKLTSLRRIRRLETVWDDDARFADAARCRSEVARRLFLECDTTGGKKNSLISAGYGGWLMYSAASAGDARFIRELLDRDPLLVFGEGEYGVSDILYAAARGKSSDVFRLIRDLAVSPRCPDGAAWSRPGGQEDNIPTFEWEITNRAAHAAARGGNLEMLRELLSTCSDPLDFRDAQGSTVLHAAAGRGQVEVAKWLLAVSSEFIDSKDQHGNTALHVAALRGQLPVLQTLATASPACVGGTNNDGDTLLHVAVAGFRHPGFRRLDRQMELVRWLAADNEAMVNARNGDGRTALHVAAAGDVPAELVELLLAVRGIEPNIQDGDGMTALDLLRRRPRSPATEVLIRRVATAGGTLTSSQRQHRPAVKTARQLRFPASPGTVFGVPDEEIFLLFSGLAGDRRGWRSSSCASSANSEPSSAATGCSTGTKKKKKNKRSTVLSAAKHLKLLLTWPRRNGGTVGRRAVEDSEGDDGSSDLSGKWCSDNDDVPTPLRQRFSQPASLHANKRVLAQPSTSLPERGAAGPTDRSRRTTPQPSPPCSISSSLDEQQEDIWRDVKGSTGSKSSSSTNSRKATAAGTIEGRGFRNSRLITGYLCFRTMMPESGEGRRLGGFFRRS